MKIITWNINSIRLRFNLLRKVARQHKPDIIALQETKVTDELFPIEKVRELGYNYFCFAGEKSYNGVAILSKLPIDKTFSLEFYNSHKRHIAASIAGIEVHNFYVPAGGEIPDADTNPKFKHKLEYLEFMRSWFAQNRALNNRIIVCGDLNIAPHEHDVWSSVKLKNVVSHTPIERQKLIEVQNSLGFIDSARPFIPLDQKLYTWWTYRTIDWNAPDRGRRLDHIWLSRDMEPQLKTVLSLREARGWQQPSDHVPYIVEVET